MLIIIILAVLTVISFVIMGMKFYYHWDTEKYTYEGFRPFYNDDWRLGLFICCITLLLLTLIIGSVLYLGLTISRTELDEQCAAIEFQIENEAYGNDAGLYGLNSEIAEWNADVKWFRQYRDNPWIGLFIPNYLGDYSIFEYVSGQIS